MSEGVADGRVDILIFRIGQHRYGADASQVTRIGRAGHDARLSDELGLPEEGGRALVFDTDRGEAQLCVDQVVGVRSAPVHDLRRLPLAAGPSRNVLGLWLEDGERPIVLLDLSRTVDLSGAP